MVGGKLIEIRPMRIVAGPYPGREMDVVRLWVVDTTYADDELAVFAEPADVMPELGDTIWWQCGQIMFDGDRHTLRKIAYSFDPRQRDTEVAS